MKTVKTFEEFMAESYPVINESTKEIVLKVFGDTASVFAKADMGIELMADDEDDIADAREMVANEIVTSVITGFLSQDIPKDVLPQVKKVLDLFKKDFPSTAREVGLEKALGSVLVKMSAILEVKYAKYSADISEDSAINKIASIGRKDLDSGLKATVQYLKKELKSIF